MSFEQWWTKHSSRLSNLSESPFKRLAREAYEAGRASAMQWRPIEEAPRDGTEIIIAEGSYIAIGRFNGSYKLPWRVGFQNEEAIEPTGWMPLPEPPK